MAAGRDLNTLGMYFFYCMGKSRDGKEKSWKRVPEGKGLWEGEGGKKRKGGGVKGCKMPR